MTYDGMPVLYEAAELDEIVLAILGYYDASLEYGRSTMPEAGLYYLGAALAQRDFGAAVRRLSLPAAGAPPGVRAIPGEIEQHQGEVLAAYRPPASLDEHPAFIAANSPISPFVLAAPNGRINCTDSNGVGTAPDCPPLVPSP